MIEEHRVDERRVPHRMTHDGGQRRRGIVAVAVVALLLTCLGTGVGNVRAQLANTFPTTAAVAPGGTLTLAVSTSGVLITGTSIVSCTATTPPPAASVTYSCGSGLNSGTLISQTFSVSSGPIAETVTYNANGPAAAFAAVPTATTGSNLVSCFNVTSPFTCSGTSSGTATIPGGQFRVLITGAPGRTVQITAAPNPIGTCTVASVTSAPGASTSLIYTCAAGQSVPAGTVVSGIAVQQTPPTPPPFLTLTDNFNAPLPAVLALPAPTSQALSIGAGTPPTLATINPGTGPAGTSITLTGTALNGATSADFGTTPGTNLSCNAAGTSCTVNAPALAPGPASVTVVTPGGTSNALTFTVGASAPNVPTNVALLSLSPGGAVGQPVPFGAAIASTSASCGTISSYKIDFGDGSPVQTSATPISTSHAYTSPGTFTVTLTVTDCAGGTASATSTATISGSTAPGGPSISYGAGWNLVSAPAGTAFAQAGNPLYTFQGNDAAYETLPNTSGVTSGFGYWAFFNVATSVTLSGASGTSASVPAPAGHWVMVGNPSASTTLTVRGADTVYTYDPIGGYVAAPGNQLSPGRGAWAISNGGGTITVSP